MHGRACPKCYGEIVSGSQRTSSYDLLLQRIHEHGLPEEAFGWHLDLRKFGTCRTGDSAWALREQSRGFAGWSTSAR